MGIALQGISCGVHQWLGIASVGVGEYRLVVVDGFSVLERSQVVFTGGGGAGLGQGIKVSFQGRVISCSLGDRRRLQLS